MELNTLKQNAETLTGELQWLEEIINVSMKLYWNEECDYKSVEEILPPDLSNNRSSKPLVLPKPGTVGGAKISI